MAPATTQHLVRTFLWVTAGWKASSEVEQACSLGLFSFSYKAMNSVTGSHSDDLMEYQLLPKGPHLQISLTYGLQWGWGIKFQLSFEADRHPDLWHLFKVVH